MMATQREVPGTEFVSPVVSAAEALMILTSLKNLRESLLRQARKYSMDSPVYLALYSEMRSVDALISKFGG